MDWTKGYRCSWRLFRVNPQTWADADEVGGITSATIERSRWSSAGSVLESAAIGADGDFERGYYRLAMTAVQNGERQRVDVGTFLCLSTRAERGKGLTSRSIVGRSVLYPATRTKLLAGTFVPAGSDGAEWCARLLRATIAAPVEVAGGFTVEEHHVVKSGTTVMACLWTVLSAGGMTLRTDGRGRVSIVPVEKSPSFVLDGSNASLLDVTAEEEYDLSGIPNRYTAFDGRRSVTVTNDDPLSDTSAPFAGYFDDVYDKAPVRTNGESLEGYCTRRLHELSVATRGYSYRRSVVPELRPDMVVRAKVAALGMGGDLRIDRQSLACTQTGIEVTERAYEEVRTW